MTKNALESLVRTAADPAGLLPGEGCGMVVLVRAADARAAGVPVWIDDQARIAHEKGDGD